MEYTVNKLSKISGVSAHPTILRRNRPAKAATGCGLWLPPIRPGRTGRPAADSILPRARLLAGGNQKHPLRPRLQQRPSLRQPPHVTKTKTQAAGCLNRQYHKIHIRYERRATNDRPREIRGLQAIPNRRKRAKIRPRNAQQLRRFRHRQLQHKDKRPNQRTIRQKRAATPSLRSRTKNSPINRRPCLQSSPNSLRPTPSMAMYLLPKLQPRLPQGPSRTIRRRPQV